MMQRMGLLATVIAVASIAMATDAVAQQSGKRKPGPVAAAALPTIIEGDAYLLMKNGDTKRGTGLTVVLLNDPDGRLTNRLTTVCTNGKLRALQLAAWKLALIDSEKYARAEKPGAPSMFELVSRETRLQKGIDLIAKETRDSSLSLIRPAVADSASTGMSAHYRFDHAQPGGHLVLAYWPIGEITYSWLAPISVPESGKTYIRDLDNSVARIYGPDDDPIADPTCIGHFGAPTLKPRKP
jgi:hypothetical protein